MPVTVPDATGRLRFRPVTEGDRSRLQALNADPRVMRYFPEPEGRLETDTFLDRIIDHRKRFGFSLWAVEERSGGAFVGLCGLLNFQIDAPFAPAVELGYRFRPDVWGRGYATEAARSVLRYGFETLELDQIVSFTSRLNEPSWRVMQRLGMDHDPAGDFLHPHLPKDHPLAPHVLYRLDRTAFDGDLPPLPDTDAADPRADTAPLTGPLIRAAGIGVIGLALMVALL